MKASVESVGGLTNYIRRNMASGQDEAMREANCKEIKKERREGMKKSME